MKKAYRDTSLKAKSDTQSGKDRHQTGMGIYRPGSQKESEPAKRIRADMVVPSGIQDHHLRPVVGLRDPNFSSVILFCKTQGQHGCSIIPDNMTIWNIYFVFCILKSIVNFHINALSKAYLIV